MEKNNQNNKNANVTENNTKKNKNNKNRKPVNTNQRREEPINPKRARKLPYAEWTSIMRKIENENNKKLQEAKTKKSELKKIEKED